MCCWLLSWQEKCEWCVYSGVYMGGECGVPYPQSTSYRALKTVRWRRFLFNPVWIWAPHGQSGRASRRIGLWMVSQRPLGQRLPRTWTSLSDVEWGQPSPITDCLRVRCIAWLGGQSLLIWTPRAIVNVNGAELCWEVEGPQESVEVPIQGVS